MKISHCFV